MWELGEEVGVNAGQRMGEATTLGFDKGGEGRVGRTHYLVEADALDETLMLVAAEVEEESVERAGGDGVTEWSIVGGEPGVVELGGWMEDVVRWAGGRRVDLRRGRLQRRYLRRVDLRRLLDRIFTGRRTGLRAWAQDEAEI